MQAIYAENIGRSYPSDAVLLSYFSVTIPKDVLTSLLLSNFIYFKYNNLKAMMPDFADE